MEQLEIKDISKDVAVAYAFQNLRETDEAGSASVVIARVLDDPSLSMNVKSRAIYVETSKIISDLFESDITPEKIHEAKNSVNAMLNGVMSNRITITSLIKVSSYDYYTYTHCVNVGVYAIGLGGEIGLPRNELEQIGAGGIMHDLGKAKVDINIINKPGKLTDEEFAEIKKHPAYGYNILKEQSENDEIILTSVRHHHEKLNGGGYPDGIMGDNLSLYARIVAICDIFDALTTKRSYKPALSTFDALNLMKNKMLAELDAKLLTYFIRMMGKS
ncbi:MAG: HD-GYP domain-containing protein [Helicobacteraceae bacterium]|jgi:putative nucleotidyltransferase with HDIG domain|nr:HD-GYP domain-containing protein [Helicobacteraceae bacterium]